MTEANISKPSSILTIDITDDDMDSLGVEIWSDASSGYSTASSTTILNDFEMAGPSSAVPAMNSTMIDASDFEWESEDYLKLLQKIQDDFNKEFEHEHLEEEEPGDDEAIVMDISDPPVLSTTYDLPSTSSAPPEIVQPIKKSFPAFQTVETAPACHKYFGKPFTPTNKTFLASINKDRKLLENDLPAGIYVKMFENRLDLLSALIEGPADTPYEGCLFMFDIQLSNEHPNKPPKVHFWSFCTTKLNPNLYTNGLVCLSLLGTWAGANDERWTVKSTIYQLLISIQGLILVQEPYFNEPAFHNQKKNGTYASASMSYNAKTLLLVLESMTKQILNPPEIFREHFSQYYRDTMTETHQRIQDIVDNNRLSKFPVLVVNDKALIKLRLNNLILKVRPSVLVKKPAIF